MSLNQIEVKRISVTPHPQPEDASEASVHHETAASEQQNLTEHSSIAKPPPDSPPLFQVKMKQSIKAVDGSAVLGREAMQHYAQNFTVVTSTNHKNKSTTTAAKAKHKKPALGRYSAAPNSRASTHHQHERPTSKHD